MKHHSICIFLTGLIALCVHGLFGCANHERADHSVTGKVIVDGAPYGGGSILLMADNGQGATAPLSADGTYAVTCKTGTYKVGISPPPGPDPMAPAATPSATTALPPIPLKYQDVGTSGLEIIVDEPNETLNIDISSKQAK